MHFLIKGLNKKNWRVETQPSGNYNCPIHSNSYSVSEGMYFRSWRSEMEDYFNIFKFTWIGCSPNLWHPNASYIFFFKSVSGKKLQRIANCLVFTYDAYCVAVCKYRIMMWEEFLTVRLRVSYSPCARTVPPRMAWATVTSTSEWMSAPSRLKTGLFWTYMTDHNDTARLWQLEGPRKYFRSVVWNILRLWQKLTSAQIHDRQ